MILASLTQSSHIYYSNIRFFKAFSFMPSVLFIILSRTNCWKIILLLRVRYGLHVVPFKLRRRCVTALNLLRVSTFALLNKFMYGDSMTARYVRVFQHLHSIFRQHLLCFRQSISTNHKRRDKISRTEVNFTNNPWCKKVLHMNLYLDFASEASHKSPTPLPQTSRLCCLSTWFASRGNRRCL